MPNLVFEGSIKEFQEGHSKHLKDWDDWEKNRVLKRCKCGNAYSYDIGSEDPKKCAACLDKLGEVIY